MDLNSYNIIKGVLMLGLASIYLWNVVLLLMGRRVTKADSLLLPNILVVFFAYNILRGEILAPSLFIVAVLGTWWLARYFRGHKYDVYADNKVALVEELEKAIKDLEGKDFEKTVVEKTIKYSITGTKKSIELIENKPIFAYKKNYYIKFNRWNDLMSKQAILNTLEVALQEEEVDGRAKSKLVVRFILGLCFIIITLGLASESVMEPDHIPQWILENPPTKVYLVEQDEYYTNDEIFPQLQQVIEKARIIKPSWDLTHGEMMQRAEVILYYQRKTDGEYAKLYMRIYNGVLFIPDSVMASTSLFHQVMESIHSIYDKGDGAYFELVYYTSQNEKGWRGLVEEMINSEK